MRVQIRRVRRAARCALCHDDLEVTPRACDHCAAALHQECWSLLTACPTLGCAPRVRPAITSPTPYAGATWEHFGLWLALFSMVQAAAWWVVPELERMFRELGLQLPAVMQLFLACAGLVRSPLGAALLAATIVAFRRARARPATRRALVGLSLACLATIPWGIVALALTALGDDRRP